MSSNLSHHISINRRYLRSINLDRDLEIPTALSGYVLTPKNREIAIRLLSSMVAGNSVRAWTLTGVYGTGKSAFAHFLTALCAPSGEAINTKARNIARKSDLLDWQTLSTFRRKFGRRGLVRAVAVAQREPVASTIIRALSKGASIFWEKTRGRKPVIVSELRDLYAKSLRGSRVDPEKILELVRRVADASKSGLLLIIDELGKNLEYTTHSLDREDLYLLQQIAELPRDAKAPPISLLGILHQSFVDYARGLTTTQRNEWAKIQGRFESIPFAESTAQMMNLIGHVICKRPDNSINSDIRRLAKKWRQALKGIHGFQQLSVSQISSVYPLHPVTAVILPILCYRFGQNDRTIFTFLTSEEPHSLARFLNRVAVTDGHLPAITIDQIYDYFVEAAGFFAPQHPMFQRWSEVYGTISDAKGVETQTLRLLKTIGVLNLVSQTGELRAAKHLVLLAMCEDPGDLSQRRKWERVLGRALKRHLVTWRKQIDELRIWEGTDFDTEQAIKERRESIRTSLARLLSDYRPLSPIVAHRHSYQIGALRCLDRRYVDATESATTAVHDDPRSDGLVCYWVGDHKPSRSEPKRTPDGKPIVVLYPRNLRVLRSACLEYVALRMVESNFPQLQSDGVARREVRQRLIVAKQLLDKALLDTFDPSEHPIWCSVMGIPRKLVGGFSLNNLLSEVCDKVYGRGPRLWNELINRGELTSQGAKARRRLLEAMLANEGEETLEIKGYGPERSMFESLLARTGIYSRARGRWRFCTPHDKSGVCETYKAIEDFCLSSTQFARPVDSLYRELKQPPYGAKSGIIPVLLLSVLLKHVDDISLYLDGSFIPNLGPEHLELLAKRPERFSVKHFKLSGLRVRLFRDLESAFRTSHDQKPAQLRNATVLAVVTPLIRFIRSLPDYTINTEKLKPKTLEIRRSLLESKEPDKLVFEELPLACGLPVIASGGARDDTIIVAFRRELIRGLQELQMAYEELLEHCSLSLRRSFAVGKSNEKFREHFRARATMLISACTEPQLRSFVKAAAEETPDDRKWLESLLMIIADRPVRSWSDTDVTLFETNLADIARRFMSFEALQSEFMRGPRSGFDPARIILTKHSGEENRRVVWVQHEARQVIDSTASEILQTLRSKCDPYLLHGVVVSMLEKTLFSKAKDPPPRERGKEGSRHDQKD